MELNKANILNALSNVEDPDLKKDLVTLGMIQNLEVEGNHVKFTLVLTTPACPLKEVLKNACINAVKQLVNEHAEVEVELSSKVTTQHEDNSKKLGGIKNIIAVASGKGGVGKSTIALNLALGLQKSGAKTGILDADIHGPSIPSMLGIANEAPETQQQGKNIVLYPVNRYGLKVMSMGMLVNPNQPMIWRGPMVSSALKQMFVDVDWGSLDYLVVDLPPGTGDIHLTLMQHFPVTGAVIVTTPQEVALADTRRTIEMFKNSQINVPMLGIVENMSWFTPLELPENKYYLFGKGGGEKLASEYQLPFIAQVPLSQGVAEESDRGKPALLYQQPEVQRPFLEMAASVAQRISIVNARSAGNKTVVNEV